MPRRGFNKLFLLTIILVFSLPSSGSVAGWPTVKEINVTYHFYEENFSGIRVPVFSLDGRLLYELSCYPQDYSGDKDFDYSGVIDCRFISKYSEERVSTLFSESENQTADWENRGRFLVEHLRPGCSRYPEWGAERSFFLRGIAVVLSARNIQFVHRINQNDLIKFDFNIVVKNDENAKTELARPSEVKEPGWFYHPDVNDCL